MDTEVVYFCFGVGAVLATFWLINTRRRNAARKDAYIRAVEEKQQEERDYWNRLNAEHARNEEYMRKADELQDRWERSVERIERLLDRIENRD